MKHDLISLWQKLIAWYGPICWSKAIAWTATVLCAGYAARCATVFARQSQRVFTILVLFSLNWALLIPYYRAPAPSELFAGFQGLLLVYIGVLLRREAEEQQATPEQIMVLRSEVSHADRVALRLFVLLVVPSLSALILPVSETPKLLRFPVTEPILATVLLVIGYWNIYKGMKLYSQNDLRASSNGESRSWKKPWTLMSWMRALAALLLVYAAVEFMYTYNDVMLILDQLGSGTKQPAISEVTPASGPAGTPVIISGKDFGKQPDSRTLTFKGQQMTILKWTDTQIIARIPIGIDMSTEGPIEMNGTVITSAPFTVSALPAFGTQLAGDFFRKCPEPTDALSPFFLWLYAILKILFTVLFIYLVLRGTPTAEQRLWVKSLMFFGVPIRDASRQTVSVTYKVTDEVRS